MIKTLMSRVRPCGPSRAILFAVITSLGVALPGCARAQAPFSGCLGNFWDAQPPVVTIGGLGFALCSRHFASLYSARTETPVYSAEHLAPAQIEAAIHLRRIDDFHEDRRLPRAVTSTPSDFRHSGYDRGHMAPSGDEPDEPSQRESFSLSNMVPQNPNDNRHLWAGIEAAVRKLVLTDRDDVYVVTGPLFGRGDPMRLHGRVLVPALLYKAVYDPDAGIAGVYVVRNAGGDAYWSLSLEAFTARYGVQPFPGLSPQLQAAAAALPRPMLRHWRGARYLAKRRHARLHSEQLSGIEDAVRIEHLLGCAHDLHLDRAFDARQKRALGSPDAVLRGD